MLNVSLKTKEEGVTLIELIIGVLILGILMSVAAPSFQAWMRNTEIRNAAESVASGIQRARAEAVARNTAVAFALGAGTSWTVSVVATGIPIDSRASHEGSKNVTLVAVASDLATPATTITFDNLGRAVPVADSLALVNFTADGGTRDLRVTIGLGGNARMCNPNLSTGPAAC